MKVVIAGASNRRLCAAIALTKVGFEVEVVERAPVLTEVGAGIQLSPNAVKGLAGLGVAEAVLAVSSQPQTLEMRIGRTGEKVFSIPIAKDARKRYGAPYLHVHRADLIEILKRSAEFAGAHLRLNARVAAYVREDTGLRVGLNTGAIIPADLLVGADGARSTVRKQMLGEDQARCPGAVAWRITVAADVAPAACRTPRSCGRGERRRLQNSSRRDDQLRGRGGDGAAGVVKAGTSRAILSTWPMISAAGRSRSRTSSQLRAHPHVGRCSTVIRCRAGRWIA